MQIKIQSSRPPTPSPTIQKVDLILAVTLNAGNLDRSSWFEDQMLVLRQAVRPASLSSRHGFSPLIQALQNKQHGEKQLNYKRNTAGSKLIRPIVEIASNLTKIISFFCLFMCWAIIMELPGSSMLSVSGCLLKGSVGELSRWRKMMDLSMMFPEGSITGSVIRVSIRGSVVTHISQLGHKFDSKHKHTSNL